ncbi:MAG TPA: UDP-glucose 4-epimerase GalE [Casimicrobiaceae bacterium]|nr:UDP-glucose 4-epimerase GalE [Casimicrobiaceae bacterium]
MGSMAETVLVTGGAGYVGSHVVAELARCGYAPIVLDNFVNSSPAVLPRLRRISNQDIPCVAADVRDLAALERVLAEHGVSAVVHCAGLKAVREGEAQPLRYYDNNVGGALALIAAMKQTRVKKLVFSSSASVYGQPDRNPVAEDAPLRATSVYGRTKRDVEHIFEQAASADDAWSVALLRYFNPAGAHPSAEIGESPTGTPNNLVPILAQVASGRRGAIEVYGDDWPTPDGTGVRDYIHVMDLAEGHIAALAHLGRFTGVGTFNLGSGSGHSVLEMIAAFEHACGHPIARRVAPRRAGDVAICFADPARANSVLGWRSRRDLDTICADAWRWATSPSNASWNASTPL